ncbi:MAG: adenylate/guanylate cyclase domain-containing protein [Planctomycetota bacterium]
MFELQAEGPQHEQNWRRKLTDGVPLELGRSGRELPVAWDSQISRQHARVQLIGERLHVEQLPEARNPILFQGREQRSFELRPNQRFVIGQTLFTFLPRQAVATLEVPAPLHERAFSNQFLRELGYRDTKQRLALLSRLPALIGEAAGEQQLYDGLTRFLLAGVSRAQTVGLVACPAIAEESKPAPPISVLHWESREVLEHDFQPSESLIRRSLESGKTVLHFWGPTVASTSQYTLQQNADWAFVCPLAGNSCRDQAIYVSGKSSSPEFGLDEELLQDDMKFAELVGTTYSNLRELAQLQQRQASLRSFFSPIVLEAISGKDIDRVLEPRESRVTILFCDLRGFSATSEEMSSDLLHLLDQVSRLLGIVTSQILDRRGVVGDFHGDAVMGFWGWPLEQPDAALRAAETALAVAELTANWNENLGRPRDQFLIGMGLASGVAVAGKIGTSDQVKVTAFGPVVNLASRFEGLTRAFRVPVLLDEATALAIQPSLPTLKASLRRIARVLPAGLARPVPLFQLASQDSQPELLTPTHLEQYEEALKLFEAGDWIRAEAAWKALPANDRVVEVPLKYIQQHGGSPPVHWNQAIEFLTK